MFRNYLLSAIRQLGRKKLYSLITSLTLFLGIFTASVISVFISNEYSYDKVHTKGDRIYRLGVEHKTGGKTGRYAIAAPAMGPALKNNIAEIEEQTRLLGYSGMFLFGDQKIKKNFFFADNSIFSVFNVKLSKGEATALKHKYSAIISEKLASRFKTSPIGTTVRFNDEIIIRITGIFKDLPKNTRISTDMFVSLKTVEDKALWGSGAASSWKGFNFYTFLLLNKTGSIDTVSAAANRIFADKYRGDEEVSFYPEKFSELYINSDTDYSLSGGSKSLLIGLLVLTALLIMSLSIVNSVNLATSRASVRTTEAGIRKLMGGTRYQLFAMVLAEQTLQGICILLLLLSSSFSVSHLVSAFTGKAISVNPLLNYTLFISIYLTASTLTISSAVTAYLMKYYTPGTLRNRKTGTGSAVFKKSMLFIQFAISTTIVIGTIQIAKQIDYINGKSLGFSKANLLYLQLSSNSTKKRAHLLQQQLEAIPEVVSTTVSSRILGNVYSGWNIKHRDSEKTDVTALFVDYGFLETFGMKIGEGRTFSRKHPADEKNGIILNREAVKALKLDNPVGTAVNFSGRKCVITGVIEDVNFQPLNRRATPLTITFHTGDYHKWYVAVRISPGSQNQFMKTAADIWKKYSNGDPFIVRYQDEQLLRLYSSEKRLLKIMLYSSFIAIFISCTGLMGIASFIIQSRRKELSIRKILGATTAGMIKMLINEFGMIVSASLLLSFPAAYMLADNWLSSYSFRISQDAAVYIVTGMLMLLLTSMAIVATAWKTAAANPAGNLRND